MRAADGFSLIELIVAMLASLLLLGTLVATVNPARQIAQAQPEAMDMQQGGRFGLAAFHRDLYVAGAGLDAVALGGPLTNYLPPVLPRRIGARDADAATVARADAISLLWVPSTIAQTTLASPMTGGLMMVENGPGCVPGYPSCGFQNGMGVLVFDRTGRFNIFTAQAIDVSGVSLRHRGSASVAPYPAGSFVAELSARTYYFDAAKRQIRRYDTDASDVPLLDDVTMMKVEYFGVATAPSRPKPPMGVANCLYDAGGQRLPVVSPPGTGDAEVLLPLEIFRDGPWCGAGGLEFDADTLRIRRIRITLGVQASSPSLRGTGLDFAHGGTTRSAWRRLSDFLVAIDVAPRNLLLTRQEAP